MWFESLMGFCEESPDQVRAHIVVDGETMTSKVNGKTYRCGGLETPTLDELRTRVRQSAALVIGRQNGRLRLSETVMDVQELHLDAVNAGALFQVASQFNLLEMISPSVTPEEGVDIYEHDRTQGPACAIAAGAGTVFRNYFVTLNGCLGQTANRQIDCLYELGQALGNRGERLWTMQNGYALPSERALREINEMLCAMDESDRDLLRMKLRVGLHWDTEVTLAGAKHTVSQAYCSALPVAYQPHNASLWEKFAVLVLEAAYEATLCAATLNLRKCGSNKLFLTLLGGGAFGNSEDWILSAIERAVNKFVSVDLDVVIVSFRSSNPRVRRLVSESRRRDTHCDLVSSPRF